MSCITRRFVLAFAFVGVSGCWIAASAQDTRTSPPRPPIPGPSTAPVVAGSLIAGAAAITADKITLGDGYVRLPYGALTGETTFVLSAASADGARDLSVVGRRFIDRDDCAVTLPGSAPTGGGNRGGPRKGKPRGGRETPPPGH